MALTHDELRAACAALPGAIAEYPFGPGARVYKAGGKMFALIHEDGPPSISLKCDPALAEILRSRYAAVTPGYHLNKRHWNTVLIDGSIQDDEIFDMISQSHDLIVRSLTKSQRAAL
jgi:predicted DNA-binding protein (MmcQ/YjbR family)